MPYQDPLFWLAVLGSLSGLGILYAVLVWLWNHMLRAPFGRLRMRYRLWRMALGRRLVEKKLDKAPLAVSRERAFKAVHPGCWPEPAKRLWREATLEVIENNVHWPAPFPEQGGTVRCVAGVAMEVTWPTGFRVLGPPDITDYNSRVWSAPSAAGWDWPSGCPHMPSEGPVIGGQPPRATPRSAG